MLREHTTYRELGIDYFDRYRAERLKRRSLAHLQRLGSRNPHRPNSQTNQAVIGLTAFPLIWLDSDSRSLTRQGVLTCQSSGNPQVERRQSEDGVRRLPLWR